MKPGRDSAVQLPGLFLVHHNLPGKAVDFHAHAEHLLFVPLAGEIRVLLLRGGDRSGPGVAPTEFALGPGQMLFLPSGAEHRFESRGPQGERLIALISPRAWERAEAPARPVATRLPASALVRELLFFLFTRAAGAARLPDARAAALVATLCQVLGEELDSPGRGAAAAGWDQIEARARDPRVRRALAAIQRSLGEIADGADDAAPSLAAIAREAGLSDRSLSRQFRAELGLTPREALAAARMERAQAALAAGDRSVSEVAWSLGYRSLSSFIAAFRAATGELPSEFARRGR